MNKQHINTSEGIHELAKRQQHMHTFLRLLHALHNAASVVIYSDRNEMNSSETPGALEAAAACATPSASECTN
jgi:hypothetical protein